jgi:glycosyltransferase involved in cell wall biosynthesis
MSHAQPAATVLMPLFNGKTYLTQAVESILGQTFGDFELLVIDDGSTDDGPNIVKGYRDPRIRLLANDTNLGIAATLNRGIGLARGKYVARMDCDDISLPHRLEKQFAFMEAHPDVGVCGSRVRRIGAKKGIWKVKARDEAIKSRLLFENAMAHPSVMIRKSVLVENNLRYDPALRCSQDYAFWVDLSRHSRLANLEQVLVLYRVHASQISEAKKAEQRCAADGIRARQLRLLSKEPTLEDVTLHGNIATYELAGDRHFVDEAGVWLSRLRGLNAQSGYYGEPAFSEELADRWYKLCKKSSRLGLWIWKRYRSSDLAGIGAASAGRKAELLIASLFHGAFDRRLMRRDAGVQEPE